MNRNDALTTPSRPLGLPARQTPFGLVSPRAVICSEVGPVEDCLRRKDLSGEQVQRVLKTEKRENCGWRDSFIVVLKLFVLILFYL